jgi:aspartyl/glutamyl-tRNA(Asn/Gln) amidotransferase C subunit
MRMAVTPEEVRRAAALARLPLRDVEVERMTVELGSILEHLRALGGAEAGDLEGFAVAPVEAGPFRDDSTPADLLHRSPDMLAPAWADGFFVVPRLPALDPDAPASTEAP